MQFSSEIKFLTHKNFITIAKYNFIYSTFFITFIFYYFFPVFFGSFCSNIVLSPEGRIMAIVNVHDMNKSAMEKSDNVWRIVLEGERVMVVA